MSSRVRHGNCELCNRTTHLTFHHLVPRKLHRRKRFAKNHTREQLNEGVMLCSRCHRGIHKLHSEMDLGSRYNTLEALRNEPAIARHVAWVRRQKS